MLPQGLTRSGPRCHVVDTVVSRPAVSVTCREPLVWTRTPLLLTRRQKVDGDLVFPPGAAPVPRFISSPRLLSAPFTSSASTAQGGFPRESERPHTLYHR